MITVMSLDRYLCVSKPVKYRIFQKASKTRKIVAMGLLATWITVFFVYGVLAFGWTTFTGRKDLDYDIECEMPFIKNLSMNLIWIASQFVIPLVLLSFFNIKVFHKINLQTKGISDHSLALSTATNVEDRALTTNSNVTENFSIDSSVPGAVSQSVFRQQRSQVKQGNSNFEKRRKSVRLLATYVVVFLICWIPFNVMILIDTLCSKCSVSVNVYVACVYILDINSLLNPIIYTIRNPSFRQDVRALFG